MKNFKKGGFGGGFKGGDRGGFKPRFDRGGDRGGDRSERPLQMHQATCSECQKACEVPFRPTGERPVYCRDCFSTKGPGAGRDGDARPARPSFGGPRKSFAPRQDFRPAHSAPRENSDGAIRDLKTQMEAISSKLDRLIDTIATSQAASSGKKEAAAGDSLSKTVKKVAAKKKGKASKK